MQPLSPVQLKQFSIWIEMCDMISIWFNCNRLGLSGYAECYFIAKAAGIVTLGKGQKRQNQKFLIQLLLSVKGAGCLSKTYIFLLTSDTYTTLLHTTQTLIVQYFFPPLLSLKKDFGIFFHQDAYCKNSMPKDHEDIFYRCILQFEVASPNLTDKQIRFSIDSSCSSTSRCVNTTFDVSWPSLSNCWKTLLSDNLLTCWTS